MPKIFITGAFGFIGGHLAKILDDSGNAVAGIGHGSLNHPESDFLSFKHCLFGAVNFVNLCALREAFGAPDFIFHLAGGSSVGASISDPHADFTKTVVCTGELLDWIRREAPDCTLVAVSSAAVYGDANLGLIAEDVSLSPFSPYGQHKFLMENLCRFHAKNYGLRVVIARLFSVFGSGLRKQLLWDICKRLSASENPISLGGSGAELRDWTDVRDVVRALSLVSIRATSDAPVFNIGTGRPVSVSEIASRLVLAWAGRRQVPELVFTGNARVGDPFSLVADSSRLRSLGFDFQMGLDRGLGDYVSWFRDFHGARS